MSNLFFSQHFCSCFCISFLRFFLETLGSIRFTLLFPSLISTFRSAREALTSMTRIQSPKWFGHSCHGSRACRVPVLLAFLRREPGHNVDNGIKQKKYGKHAWVSNSVGHRSGVGVPCGVKSVSLALRFSSKVPDAGIADSLG